MTDTDIRKLIAYVAPHSGWSLNGWYIFNIGKKRYGLKPWDEDTLLVKNITRSKDSYFITDSIERKKFFNELKDFLLTQTKRIQKKREHDIKRVDWNALSEWPNQESRAESQFFKNVSRFNEESMK